MPVGGTSEALLAFGPMPEPSRILRALLVVHPHERRPWVQAPGEIVVENVGAFVGGALAARHGRQPTSFAAARRLLAPGPARSLRFDVTGAARAAAGRPLRLLMRVEGDGRSVSFSSPWASEAAHRPRLEVMVR